MAEDFIMSMSKFRHHTEAPAAPPGRRPAWRARLRALPLAAVAGVALTVTGIGVPPGSVTAAAQTPSPSATSKKAQYCEDFVQHLSSNVGLSPARLRAAIARAASQTADDAVRHGDLTAQQANAIKSRLANGQICRANLSGLGGPVARGLVLSAAAGALGTTPEQLRTQLAQGKTVSEIAPPGMTEQQFATGFETNLKKELDAQVKAGNLTPAQETAALQHAPAVAQHLWTSGAPGIGSPSPSGP